MSLVPKDGYWLGEKNIAKIEKLKDAKYMGYFCTKSPSGNWNEQPVDVFYQPNANTDLGHSNYFGIFYRSITGNINQTLYITDASSCFSEPITGLQFDDGTIILSRYRHDYVEYQDIAIDGGRDYTKINGDISKVKQVTITVNGGEFVVD